MLEEHGEIRVTRMNNLPNVVYELGYGDISGGVDEIFYDSVNPCRGSGVLHGRRR